MNQLLALTSTHLLTSGGAAFHSPSHAFEYIATAIFAMAVIHTFITKHFLKLAERYENNTVLHEIFEFMGEVEVVFGLWAFLMIVILAAMHGPQASVAYLDSRNFTEPAFVFVIMAMAATQPVIYFAGRVIGGAASLIPLKGVIPFYISALIIGPLMGSFITEPAAMTVTALLLKEQIFEREGVSRKFMYATLGLLFVNISVGGTLTHFAAPPVLMVARPWGWDLAHMLEFFGYKSALGVIVGTLVTAFVFRKELAEGEHHVTLESSELLKPKAWIILFHLIFLAMVVIYNHHISVFMALFIFFMGWVQVTKEYQSSVKLRESLLVAFFLGGLVTLGGMQGWWLQRVLTSLGDLPLFLSATGLTAITDNAALTYLGTQVQGLSDASKYALVAGAVAGGGLTVIANAPNPAGYGILRDSFGKDGISPLGLLLGALPYTFLVMACLWLLPNFQW